LATRSSTGTAIPFTRAGSVASASARARGDDITAYNCGVRRAISDEVKASWLAEATSRLPAEHRAAVVFSFGANDRVIEQGRSRVPYPRQMENARAILTAAKARWPTLFITSPLPLNEALYADAAVQAQGIGQICQDLGVPFLDMLPASRDFSLWREEASAGDGAHPGAGGYGEFAALVDAWTSWRALLEHLRR